MEPASFAATLVRVALACLGVGLLAIVVLRLALARIAPPGRTLRVLDRLPLERGRTLFLVEAPGKVVVLACDPSGTRVVAELDPEAVGEALSRAPEAPAPPWWDSLVRRGGRR